jgi:tellurite resistance protein TehA-like permease
MDSTLLSPELPVAQQNGEGSSQTQQRKTGKQPLIIREQQVAATPTSSPRESIDLEKQNERHMEHGEKDPNQPKLSLSQRIRHFTWAWYTLTMSTGGVATLISIQPHSFPGLISIGAAFYIANLIMFVLLCTSMILRFAKCPGTLKESLKHEREGLFYPTFWLSVATIVTGTQKYVVQAYEINASMRSWLITTIAIAFWVYTACTFMLAVVQYSFLFIGHTYMLTKMMPSWLLPVFPVMLSGTIASVIAADQPMSSRIPIVIAGLACQGLGFTISVIMYAHYIGRLMQAGLPNREHRPAMFIGVGPPSFTALALLGMANAFPAEFEFNGDDLMDGAIMRTLALTSAVFLWALALWFFCISIIAVGALSLLPCR